MGYSEGDLGVDVGFIAQASEHGERMQRAADTHEEDKALLVGKHEEERARMESELADQLQQLRDSSQNERDGIKLRFEQQIAADRTQDAAYR